MLLYWIWLAELKGISLTQKHRLLEQAGDPETLYHSPENRWDIPEKLQSALGDKNLTQAEKILADCKANGIGVLPISDIAYPARLQNTPDAPLVLYYRGILPDWDSVPFIGAVGTRKATVYGMQIARRLACQITRSGGCVVSGGAAGVDTAAMRGGLDADGAVIGVLGCGVDVTYPRSNKDLFAALLEKGCLISEYPPGTEPLSWNFPARNRIISGISSGVLVVEAPEKSGALITARYAMEQGRDVFVVPGNIDNATCAGSNQLLQEGASPVFSGWNVLENYEFLYPGKLKKHPAEPFYANKEPEARVAETITAPTRKSDKTETARKNPIDNGPVSAYSVLNAEQIALNADEQAIISLLTTLPQEPADLMAKLTMSSGKVLSVLTMLSIKGLVQKHPGGRFSLK